MSHQRHAGSVVQHRIAVSFRVFGLGKGNWIDQKELEKMERDTHDHIIIMPPHKYSIHSITSPSLPTDRPAVSIVSSQHTKREHQQKEKRLHQVSIPRIALKGVLLPTTKTVST